MSAPDTFAGHPKEEIKDLLKFYDWNWYLVADHIGCDAMTLKETFASEQPRSKRPVPDGPLPFASARIKPSDIVRLQKFVKEHFKDSLPILFDEELSEERRSEMAKEILIEFGLPYKLMHAQEFKDTYKVIEDEAIALEKWREQITYLNVIEEVLFRVSVALQRERRAEAAAEQGSDLEDEDD